MSRQGDLSLRREQLLARLRSLCQPPLMRGSIIERVRRCGRSNCACARDPAARHRGRYLSVHLDGKTQAIMLREQDVERVREAIDTYDRIWALLNQLTACELDHLRFAAAERRRARRRRA